MDDFAMPVIVSTPVVQEQSKAELLDALQGSRPRRMPARSKRAFGPEWVNV